MSHYLGLCVSFKGKNDFSNLVSVQQLGTLVGRRRIATNLVISIKYHADACVCACGFCRLWPNGHSATAAHHSQGSYHHGRVHCHCGIVVVINL